MVFLNFRKIIIYSNIVKFCEIYLFNVKFIRKTQEC